MATPTPVEQFQTLIRSLPFTPNTTTSTGLFTPFLRAVGHLLFVLAAINETRCAVLTPEEIATELTHAAEHINVIGDAQKANLSRAASAHLTAFQQAVNMAATQYATWPETDRTGHLRDLTNRAAGIATYFDRELAGLAAGTVDAGSSL
jgi:hypothetical protein